MNKNIQLYLGDSKEILKKLPENSIDTIITDIPYGLKFMGKKWDYQIPTVDCFKEMLKTAKPGATLLCFGGTRTYHRIACNIEDAGWIIKDCILWIYATGFPKATDISKQLDKKAGVKHPKNVPISENKSMSGANYTRNKMEVQSNEAKLWSGWKSHGLKPAYEPILVAIKPNEGTYAENAIKHGVSGLNIDGARIGHNEPVKKTNRKQRSAGWNLDTCGFDSTKNTVASASPHGRFPANIILDEEAARLLDLQSGELKSGKPCGVRNTEGGYHKKYGSIPVTGIGDKGGASRFFYVAKASKRERNMGCEKLEEKKSLTQEIAGNNKNRYSMSLFCKKCGKRSDYKCNCNVGWEQKTQPGLKQNKNNHPTVKPLELMKYLCTLTKTPTGGVVLDPFMGSGTTGMACKLTGRKFIGIEMNEEYMKIAQARIKAIK